MKYCENCGKTLESFIPLCNTCAYKIKPPLGLMPRNIWKSRRIFEIMKAMIRYEDANMIIPAEWWVEMCDHLLPNPEVQGPPSGGPL